MVNLAVFLFTTSETRGREDHQNLGGLGLFQVMFRNPNGQFLHQLLLQQACVVDLFARSDGFHGGAVDRGGAAWMNR